MSFALFVCSIFGHDFVYGETKTRKEFYKGRWHIIEKQRKCLRCGLSEVDNSGAIELFNAKLNGADKMIT
jgi:hypothetical protein